MIGAEHKSTIVKMVERKSGYAVITKVVSKSSEFVGSAIVDKLKHLASRMKTLTIDYSKEFAGYEQIDQQIQSSANFVRPFASCERGSNENLNGMLRQHTQKKSHLPDPR